MKNCEDVSVGVSVSPSKQTPETPSTCDTQVNSSETAPTQEMASQESQDEVDNVQQPWGRLFPLGNTSVESLELRRDKETYCFGRGSQCDFVFNSDFKDHQSISKNHFTIYLENTDRGQFPFLEDKSSNGTYINGERVGKGNTQHLQNNDEIAVCYPTSKIFVYMDNSSTEEDKFPSEVTKKYTISKTLGRGACGEVKLAFKKNTSEPVAIKIIQKKKFSIRGSTSQMNSAKQIQREIDIMQALKHPCIVAVYDVIDITDTVYIILELVQGGELFDRIITCKVLEEPIAKFYFYQMVLAIKYLHDQNITHRDLKLENVLLSDNTEEALIKITDFGLAKFIDGGSMLKTFCGTPNYLAPEILHNAGRGSYTNAVDCWSLGVILYSILGGYPPFTGDRKDMKLAHQIVKGSYSFPNQYWKGVSPKAIDLIKRLLTVDFTKRITLAECLDHEWLQDKAMIKKASKLIQITSCITPSKRNNNMPPPSGSALKRRRLEKEEITNNNDGSNTPSTTGMDFS